MSTKYEVSSDFLRKHRINEIIDGFASLSELYSVLLDINGKILIEPSGPSPYLGEFHEIVENPKYKEAYYNIVNCIVDSKQSMYCDLEDGNPNSRFAAAPIFINGRFFATWLLYARNNMQYMKLFKAFEKHNLMAEVLSDTITKLYLHDQSSDKDEDIKTELEFERQSKRLIEDILMAVSQGSKNEFLALYERVGKLLDVDFIVFYKVDKRRLGKMKLVDYWAKEGKSKESKKTFEWDNDHFDTEIQNKIKTEGLIVDKTNMTNRMRVEVFQGNVRAIMVFPVTVDGSYMGRLIFIENSKERVWNNVEIKLAKELTSILEKNILINNRAGVVSDKSNVIKEVFDEIPTMIMIRQSKDGKILYANKAMEKIAGRTLEGTDSYRFLPRIVDELGGYEEKSAGIDKTKKVKYKRFIEKLNGIYDISEHPIEWQEGIDASIVLILPENDE